MAKNRGIENSTATSSEEEKAKGRTFLLTIAIDYPNGNSDFLKLDHPINDAKALMATLKAEFEIADSISLENEEANRSNILKHLKNKKGTTNKFFDNEVNDTLVVFFAGHGYTNEAGFFWVTMDGLTEEGIDTEECVEFSQALKGLRVAKFKRILFIIDCCFSGEAVGIISEKKVFQTAFEESDTAFFAIASVDRDQKTPDDSRFLKYLLDCLKNYKYSKATNKDGGIALTFRDIEGYLNGTSGIQEATPPVIYGLGHTKQYPLLFRKEEDLPPPKALREAIVNRLNFNEQVGCPDYRKGIGVLNLLYLAGPKNCGHHLFLQRYFHDLGEELTYKLLGNYPIVLNFYNHEAIPSWGDIRQQIASQYLVSCDRETIVKQLLQEAQKSGFYLLWVKVHESFEGDLTGQVATIWQNLNQSLNSVDLSEGGSTKEVFLVILDRRKEYLGLEIETLKKASTKYSELFVFSPVRELDYKKDIQNFHRREKKKLGQKFNSLLEEAEFEPDRSYPFEDAVRIICEYCKRKEEVFYELFKKGWP